MRNLKRALSLALASVMLVGMMVVGTSAASYPDVDSNDNVEAISVLQAVGVMQGDGDTGEFRPDSEVSRNEMAVIMARLLLGPDADDYVGTHPFTDVPAWADKYVAACYNDGIIKGMDDTTYGGKETVTAQEAAAMMLRALGYEKLEGTGSDWARPVVAKANQIRLFADVGSNPTAAMTRNQIAQLGLNTLKADVVISDVEQDIVVEGVVTIPGKVTYTKVEYTSEGTDNYAGSTASDAGYNVQQLCEKLYGNDLKLEPVAAGDDFGRPASKWVYDRDDVITIPDDATETYIGAVELGDIYDDLGLSSTISATVKVDGASASDASVADNSTAKIGADGQTVEVYYDKSAGTVKISIISSYLGVVTDDSAKSGDKTGIRVDVSGVGAKFFETDTQYAEDDVVLLTMADGDIYEITGTPETVSGEVTRVGSSDYAVTIDGAKYPQAAKFDDADGDVIKGESSMSGSAVGNSYILYLDANGCYLAAVKDEENTSTDLVYVFDVNLNSYLNTSDNKVEPKVMATVVEMDGTYRDVAITYYKDTAADATEITDADNTAKGAVSDAFKGTLAYLTYDEDDKEYTLTTAAQYDGDYSSKTIGVNIVPDAAYKIEAKDTNTRFGDADGDVYYLNSKTVFLFVSTKDSKIDKVEMFTGGVDANIAAATVGAVAHESNKRVGYVVIEEAYSASADDVIYIVDENSVDDVKDGKTYKGYIVGQDSEEQEIAIQTGSTIDAVGFYSYTTVKSNGNLDNLTKHAADAAGYVVDQTVTSLVDGDGTFSGANTAVYDFSNAVVVDVRSDTDVYGEISSLSALNRAFTRDYVITVSAYINDDKEVVGLFVTDVANPPEARTVNATAGGTVESWTLNNVAQESETISAKAGDVVKITYAASIDDQWYRFADGYTSSVVAQADQAVLTFTMPAGSSDVTLERVYEITYKTGLADDTGTVRYVKNDAEVASAFSTMADNVWDGSAKVEKATAFAESATGTTAIGTSGKTFTAMAAVTVANAQSDDSVSGAVGGAITGGSGYAVIGDTVTVTVGNTSSSVNAESVTWGGSGSAPGQNANNTFTMPATAVTITFS